MRQMDDESGRPDRGSRRIGLNPVRQRAERLTAWAQGAFESLVQQRPSHASVEIGFRWFLRDRQVAGGVLGGGLAYRLFFWGLALALLICGGLGFTSAGSDFTGALKDAGLTTAVAGEVASAAQQSEADRWWLIAIGTWSTVWFSWSLLRALRLVHAAAWQVTPPKLTNAPRALTAVLAAPCLLAVMTAAAGWVRANTTGSPGLMATLAVGILFGSVWFLISARLPAQEAVPRSAFVPGAIVFGIGLEALHVFTVYFLADKLANASDLYGVLGLATTTLFYLYLVGRGIVWAAELNAVTWTVRQERDLNLFLVRR